MCPAQWVLAGMNSRISPPPATIVSQLRSRTSYVRATEMMAILSVSRKTLCHWINTGTLPAVRIGKNNLIDPATLANWLEAQQTGA